MENIKTRRIFDISITNNLKNKNMIILIDANINLQCKHNKCHLEAIAIIIMAFVQKAEIENQDCENKIELNQNNTTITIECIQ